MGRFVEPEVKPSDVMVPRVEFPCFKLRVLDGNGVWVEDGQTYVNLSSAKKALEELVGRCSEPKSGYVVMSNMIHHICSGIATKFNPKDEDELHDLINDAWVQTMDKIKAGKLRFTHGKAPVFNLITTTVFRILYSKMNKQKRQREHHKKYTYRYVQEKAPELLPVLENPGREMCASASIDS